MSTVFGRAHYTHVALADFTIKLVKSEILQRFHTWQITITVTTWWYAKSRRFIRVRLQIWLSMRLFRQPKARGGSLRTSHTISYINWPQYVVSGSTLQTTRFGKKEKEKGYNNYKGLLRRLLQIRFTDWIAPFFQYIFQYIFFSTYSGPYFVSTLSSAEPLCLTEVF